MIQLEEKAAEALACVQKAETIMAELGHTKYSLSGMCSAAMRHDLEKEVCELLGELAEAREEISDLQGDVEAWKRETMIANARLRGEKHPDDNGAISPKEIIPKLQRELAEAREQRDALTKAMTEYMDHHIQHGFVTTAETIKAWQALVAVKGGAK